MGNSISRLLNQKERLRCSIRAPIFPSPTRVSLRSVLQIFGFPYSVFPCLRLFHDTPTMQVKHPQCTIHPLYQYQLQRESSSYSRKLVASVQDKSGKISCFCVLSCTKMVAHLTQVFTEYEERVLVLRTGCFPT